MARKGRHWPGPTYNENPFGIELKPDNAVRFDRQTSPRTPTSLLKEFDGQFDKIAEGQAIQTRGDLLVAFPRNALRTIT